MIIRDPIYQQLHDALREMAAAECAPGDRFLTEREVSKRFEVSRATANKSLSALVADGVLEFRRGIGTFVGPDVLRYDLRALVSFTDKAKAAGRRPRTRVLTFERIDAGRLEAEVTRALALEAGDPAARVERLRLADGEPIILERRCVALALCPKLSRRDLTGSLYAAWSDRHGLEIDGSDQVIDAVNLDTHEAALLSEKPGAAALRVTAVGRLTGGRPLWHERTVYRPGHYEFVTRLGGPRRPGPAVGRLMDPALAEGAAR